MLGIAPSVLVLSKLRVNENFGETEGKRRERMTSMMIIDMMLTTMWEWRGKKRKKRSLRQRVRFGIAFSPPSQISDLSIDHAN
jgi:hypothetical protein